jgi:3',5'-cyclic-AMP phosphodiesterase
VIAPRRIVWATDVHLNFVDRAGRERFVATIAEARPDLVLFTGDIAEAHDLTEHLQFVAAALDRPLYFVIGNHDCYQGTILGVRQAAAQVSEVDARIRWLPIQGVVELAEDTALVGVDGWADARLGDPLGSPVRLNDWLLIGELTLPRLERNARLRALGDAEAAALKPLLESALAAHRTVIVGTHVPPFREACWHEGKVSGDDWLPWFTCQAVGDVLLDAATRHPDHRILVLCGHTHGQGETSPLPNLHVWTGGAEYRRPRIARVLEPPWL